MNEWMNERINECINELMKRWNLGDRDVNAGQIRMACSGFERLPILKLNEATEHVCPIVDQRLDNNDTLIS